MHQEIKATVIWLALAFFLTFAGFWQAKVAIGRDFQARHRSVPPPAKTKHAIRPPPAAFTGDVVEDYIARCEKGLTDQEIGWILEDFCNLGLASAPAEGSPDTALIAYHKLQNRWYRDALTDGLRLSAVQSAEVEKNLAETLQEVTEAVLHRPTGGRFGITESLTSDELHSLFRQWFFSSAPGGYAIGGEGQFIPTPRQQDIFSNSWGHDSLDALNDQPASPKAPPTSKVDPQKPTIKGKTAATYPIGEDYPIPAGFEAADHNFPILKSQQLFIAENPNPRRPQPPDPERSEHFIYNLRHLHPAQLKIMLLFNPGSADEIQSALDNAARTAK